MDTFLINLFTLFIYHLLFPTTVMIGSVDVTYFLKLLFLNSWLFLLFFHINHRFYMEDKDRIIQKNLEAIKTLQNTIAELQQSVVKTEEDYDNVLEFARSRVPASVRYTKYLAEAAKNFYDGVVYLALIVFALCILFASISTIFVTNVAEDPLVIYLPEVSLDPSPNSLTDSALLAFLEIKEERVIQELRKGRKYVDIIEDLLKEEDKNRENSIKKQTELLHASKQSKRK